jgi:hypothetical protein
MSGDSERGGVDPSWPRPRRILVIGASGSGKSTAARLIAMKFVLTLVETDPFYWGPGWVPARSHEVRMLAERATDGAEWVLDGNFDELRDLVWARADAIVWLDYPTALILGRVVRRNLLWMLARSEVWSGNRMSLSRALSGIRHSARSIAVKRRKYPVWLSELSDKECARIRTPEELPVWMATAAARPLHGDTLQ